MRLMDRCAPLGCPILTFDHTQATYAALTRPGLVVEKSRKTSEKHDLEISFAKPMHCLRSLLVILACTTSAALRVAVAPLGGRAVASSAAVRTSPSVMQFGSKKSVAEQLEDKGYWPGEWVCADCGYIYEPSAQRPFEELRQRWKCPQCAGPRRRFVKKAGGVTAAVDDSPLIIGTVATLIATAVLVYLGLSI